MARRQRNPSTPKLEVVPRSPLAVGRTDTHGNVVYNRILLSLPDDEYDAVLPHLGAAGLRVFHAAFVVFASPPSCTDFGS